jgi:hypothetical protein
MKYILFILLVITNVNLIGQENCKSARAKYLELNPDVEKANVDPWRHYNTFGKREGRIWPNCTNVENSISVSNTKTELNTLQSFYQYKGEKSMDKNKETELKNDFNKFDSLSNIEKKYKAYNYYEGVRIDVTEKTAYTFLELKGMKLFCFEPGSWMIHKEKLEKFGFNGSKLENSHNLCRLYFAYNPKTEKYHHILFFNLDELYAQKLHLNQFNYYYEVKEKVIYSNISQPLKGKFKKFVKKHTDIVTEIDETEKMSVLQKLTNIDDGTKYLNYRDNSNKVSKAIYELTYSRKIKINNDYFYWGENNVLNANGVGYFVNQNTNEILISAFWKDGYPQTIFDLYFYKNTKEYSLKNKTNLFQIFETPNNSNSHYYFGQCKSKSNSNTFEKNGKGDYFWQDKSYSGDWLNNERSGFGTLTWNIGKKDEKYYVGSHLNGKCNGLGKIYKCVDYKNKKFEFESEGYYNNDKWEKSIEDYQNEQRVKQEQQLIAEQFANSLSSGKYDDALEKICEKIVGVSMFVGKNQGAKELETQINSLEENTLGHKMTKEEQNYFSNYLDKYMKVLNTGLQILNTSSSNQSSSRSSSYSSSNGDAKNNCSSCSGTGQCYQCSKTVKKKFYKGNGSWDERNEIKLGYLLCKNCYGYGYKTTNINCDGWCPDGVCSYRSCMDGWIFCSDCNSNGKSNDLGKCKFCKGTGKR